MEQLKSLIKSKVLIDDTQLEQIVSKFKEKNWKKNNLILRKGQIASDYYFVKKGGLRIYLDTPDKQITGWVALENDFFTELSSLKNQAPCRFNIQTIDDTTLLTISKNEMEFLYGQFPVWQQFGRIVWEEAFLKVIDAVLAYQTQSAEERYLAMLQLPDLLQKLPLKDLSSYLGVTPNSLSRIRKNIK